MKPSTSSGFFQILHTFTSKGVMIIAGFLVGVFTSRFLGPEGKGALTLLLTIPTLLVSFGEFGIRQSTAYISGRNEYPRKVIASSLMFIFICTASLCLGLVFCADKLMGLTHHGTVILLSFALLIPITLYQNYVSGFLVAEKRIEQINFMQLITPLLLFILLGVLAVAEKFTLTNVAFAYLAAQVGGLVYLVRVCPIFSFPRYNREVAGAMLKMGALYAAGLLIQSLNYRADILILGSLRGNASVGVYSVGVSICEIIKMMPLSVGMVLFSRSVNCNNEEQACLLHKVMLLAKTTFTITTLFAIIILLASEKLVPYVYGNEFKESCQVIYYLVPGVVFLSIFSVLHVFAAGQGKPEISIYAFGPGLIVNIVLNFILIPRYDYVGAAISSTVSYSFSVLLYILIFYRVYRIKWFNLLINKQDFIDVYMVIKQINKK